MGDLGPSWILGAGLSGAAVAWLSISLELVEEMKIAVNKRRTRLLQESAEFRFQRKSVCLALRITTV